MYCRTQASGPVSLTQSALTIPAQSRVKLRRATVYPPGGARDSSKTAMRSIDFSCLRPQTVGYSCGHLWLMRAAPCTVSSGKARNTSTCRAQSGTCQQNKPHYCHTPPAYAGCAGFHTAAGETPSACCAPSQQLTPRLLCQCWLQHNVIMDHAHTVALIAYTQRLLQIMGDLWARETCNIHPKAKHVGCGCTPSPASAVLRHEAAHTNNPGVLHTACCGLPLVRAYVQQLRRAGGCNQPCHCRHAASTQSCASAWWVCIVIDCYHL
jgi:hypothetical protein